MAGPRRGRQRGGRGRGPRHRGGRRDLGLRRTVRRYRGRLEESVAHRRRPIRPRWYGSTFDRLRRGEFDYCTTVVEPVNPSRPAVVLHGATIRLADATPRYVVVRRARSTDGRSAATAITTAGTSAAALAVACRAAPAGVAAKGLTGSRAEDVQRVRSRTVTDWGHASELRRRPRRGRDRRASARRRTRRRRAAPRARSAPRRPSARSPTPGSSPPTSTASPGRARSPTSTSPRSTSTSARRTTCGRRRGAAAWPGPRPRRTSPPRRSGEGKAPARAQRVPGRVGDAARRR